MTTWIEQYIVGCALCQQNKICTTKKKTPLYHIPGDPSMCQFNVVALDLITQLPKANGYNAILTIVDQGCSRAAIFLPCHTTITREGVALLYLKNLFPWFGVPSKVISDQDLWFTSHFVQALTTKLSIRWNISTAFHPQTDRLTECKNQWVEQYICLYMSARQDDWDAWLPIATFMHNCWPNVTTKRSPHKLLLGYRPSAAEEPMSIMNNEMVEERHRLIKEHREAALNALNRVAQTAPTSQYKVGEWVWLKAKYLALPYASVKLAPKCHGLFQITKEISPMAYQLTLPRAWTIHNVFHSSLLTPYKETCEHGAQFQCPLPELIDNKEEYKVEQIINHRHYGKCHQLQYLIWWKGYSAADNTWEPADQVHADDLIRSYHMRYAKEEKRDKNWCWMKIKTAIPSLLTCPPSTLQTSPLPLPLASQSIWTQQSPSQLDRQPRPQWSTTKSPSPFLPPSPLSQWNSVSSSSPLDQCVPLLKDTGHQVGRNSSSSHKDWQELCEKIKSATTIKNNSRPSNNEAMIWQSMRCMQLTWKKPMNIGRKIPTEGMQNGKEEDRHLRSMRKMKATSLISSSQSLMAITPCMSLPPTSKWTGSTAWALSASTSPSTGTNSFPHSISPSMRRGNSLIGSLKGLQMTPCTRPCTTTPRLRKIGGSQLSSSNTMTCTLKLPPWSQSKGVWLLPSRWPRSNWTKVNDTCSAHTPTSGTNSSAPSMRALTSTPSQREGSPPSLEAHAAVRLDPDQRVMSQGSLSEGKRTAGREEWVHLTPRTGRTV